MTLLDLLPDALAIVEAEMAAAAKALRKRKSYQADGAARSADTIAHQCRTLAFQIHSFQAAAGKLDREYDL